jgi:membrane protein implicated in regulation of membrane protease activity
MGWLSELGSAVLYGLAWILIIILAITAVILLLGGKIVPAVVAIGIIVAIWGGRKFYRKMRPARQTIAG